MEENKNIEQTSIPKDLEKNLWTYGSPIIFQEGKITPGVDEESVSLTLTFANIFQETIKEINLRLIVTNEKGEEETINQSYTDLALGYLQSKGNDISIKLNKNTKDIKIQIDRIIFENGGVWSKEESVWESTGEIDNLDIFAKAKLKDYEDNYVIAKEDLAKEDYINMGNGIEILKRISWYKDSAKILKTSEQKYLLLKNAEERRQSVEKKKAHRRKSVKKKYVITGVVVVAILAAVGGGFAAFSVPNNKYKAAKKLLDNKKYEQAAKSFSDLDGFLKSEGYLAEAYYNLGLKALDSKDENKAEEYFTKSYKTDKSSEYGKMAGAFVDYYDGNKALESKDYDKAMKLFQNSANVASDFTLVNKASAGMAKVYYLKQDYTTAWNTIKNVYAKDKSYASEYGTYGYAYAKTLINNGKSEEGLKLYNSISKFTNGANLSDSTYAQAVKLGESGKYDEAMTMLNSIKGNNKKAATLYNQMKKFKHKVRFWTGTWKHTGTVNGEKKIFKIYISTVLFKGGPCLRIKDQNNKTLGYDTVISSKNKVTQITIGTYQLHFKLKKYHNQKNNYVLKGGKKMLRQLRYGGVTYETKFKKLAK